MSFEIRVIEFRLLNQSCCIPGAPNVHGTRLDRNHHEGGSQHDTPLDLLVLVARGGIDHDRIIFLSELWRLLMDDRLRQSNHLYREVTITGGGAPRQHCSLRIGVNHQDLCEDLREGACYIDGDRGFAAPALLARNSNDETGHWLCRDLASKR